MTKTDEHYTALTERIVADLEKGVAPWVRPWRVLGSASDRPANFATKKAYNGINVLTLWMDAQLKGYSRNDWMTFKQGQGIGATVRKGEHGSPIIFAKPRIIEDDKNPGTTKCIGMTLQGFTVFNVDQFDDIELPAIEAPDAFESIENAEAYIAAQGATIKHGGDSAFYMRSADSITLPMAGQFESPAAYYSTSLHEHAHWTGAPSRLNRVKGKRFGDHAYAFEELVAELSSAFLCADLGLPGELRHPAYLKSWATMLGDVPKALMTAAADATKAVAFMNANAYPAQAGSADGDLEVAA